MVQEAERGVEVRVRVRVVVSSVTSRDRETPNDQYMMSIVSNLKEMMVSHVTSRYVTSCHVHPRLNIRQYPCLVVTGASGRA